MNPYTETSRSNPLKVGSFVYATNQGLGVLARDFYNHGVVTDVVVVEHAHHRTEWEWYPSSVREQRTVKARCLDLLALKNFVKTVDVMLFFETPFYWDIIPYCRANGVATILMPMHECTPRRIPHQPDLYLCPSKLDYECFRPCKATPGVEVRYLPVPVPDEVVWKQRSRAKIFVHNAGHGGLLARNGTGAVLDAMRSVKSPIKLILRSQKSLQWSVEDPRIDLRVGTAPYAELYRDGDVFLFPEKFNGLSLPLQEAYASGMVVMATDRFPMNDWLPNGPLVRPVRWVQSCISGAYRDFEESVHDPERIAAKIDEYYDQDISQLSLQGKEYAEANSWTALKPRYMEAICSLLKRQL